MGKLRDCDRSLNVGSTWLTIFGLVVTAILLVRRVPGGIFIGMAATTILGLVTGLIPMPSEIVAAAPSLKPTFLVALKHVGDIDLQEKAISVFPDGQASVTRNQLISKIWQELIWPMFLFSDSTDSFVDCSISAHDKHTMIPFRSRFASKVFCIPC